jgi:hypothetical protein
MMGKFFATNVMFSNDYNRAVSKKFVDNIADAPQSKTQNNEPKQYFNKPFVGMITKYL